MASPAWKVTGQYYETCSCDFVCPCIVTELTATPSKGSCTFAMAFQISRGTFGGLSLDGLGFLVLGFAPQEMGRGNWSSGVVVDERADANQRDAIVAMATGSAGGPMAALAGMIATFLGVESAPIRFDKEGVTWRVEASHLARFAATPAMGMDPANGEPLQLRNTGHPANTNISLAHAVESQVSAFGLSWNDVSGENSGQFAPFAWSNA